MTEAGDVSITMGIVPIWLYHKDNPNNRICVYALLDNASGGTFIKEDSLRRLGVERIESTLLLTTMHGTQEIDTKAVDGLMASHFQENEVSLALPEPTSDSRFQRIVTKFRGPKEYKDGLTYSKLASTYQLTWKVSK